MKVDDGDRVLVGAGAVAAAAIVASAAILLAPYLVMLALPLIVGTVLYGMGKRAGLPWLLLGGLFLSAIAANFVLSSDDLDWAAGDFVFILIGGPAAVVTAALSGTRLVQHRRAPQQSGTRPSPR